MILLAKVCNTTAKAPICKPTITAKILAKITRDEFKFFFKIGLAIKG